MFSKIQVARYIEQDSKRDKDLADLIERSSLLIQKEIVFYLTKNKIDMTEFPLTSAVLEKNPKIKQDTLAPEMVAAYQTWEELLAAAEHKLDDDERSNAFQQAIISGEKKQIAAVVKRIIEFYPDVENDPNQTTLNRQRRSNKIMGLMHKTVKEEGCNTLQLIIKKNIDTDYQIAKILLEQLSASDKIFIVRQTNLKTETALYTAIKTNSPKFVKMILEILPKQQHPFYLAQKNKRNSSPLDIAIQLENPEILMLIKPSLSSEDQANVSAILKEDYYGFSDNTHELDFLLTDVNNAIVPSS